MARYKKGESPFFVRRERKRIASFLNSAPTWQEKLLAERLKVRLTKIIWIRRAIHLTCNVQTKSILFSREYERKHRDATVSEDFYRLLEGHEKDMLTELRLCMSNLFETYNLDLNNYSDRMQLILNSIAYKDPRFRDMYLNGEKRINFSDLDFSSGHSNTECDHASDVPSDAPSDESDEESNEESNDEGKDESDDEGKDESDDEGKDESSMASMVPISIEYQENESLTKKSRKRPCKNQDSPQNENDSDSDWLGPCRPCSHSCKVKKTDCDKEHEGTSTTENKAHIDTIMDTIRNKHEDLKNAYGEMQEKIDSLKESNEDTIERITSLTETNTKQEFDIVNLKSDLLRKRDENHKLMDEIQTLKKEMVQMLQPTCNFCGSKHNLNAPLLYCNEYDCCEQSEESKLAHAHCSDCLQNRIESWTKNTERQMENPNGIGCCMNDCIHKTHRFSFNDLRKVGVDNNVVDAYISKLSEIDMRKQFQVELEHIKRQSVEEQIIQSIQEASSLKCPSCGVVGSVDQQCLCVHCNCGVTFCGWCYEWHTDVNSNQRDGVTDQMHVSKCSQNQFYIRDVKQGIPEALRVNTFVNINQSIYANHIHTKQMELKTIQANKLKKIIDDTLPFDMMPGEGRVRH